MYLTPFVIGWPPCSSFPGNMTACPAAGASTARSIPRKYVPPPSYSDGSLRAMVNERSD